MAKAPRRNALTGDFGGGVGQIFGASVPVLPAGVEDLDNARTIEVDLLASNPYQPRTTFDDVALQELADDIAAHGVLQPLLVRPHPHERGHYQIAAGERRWRAARLAGKTEVPCIERDMDDGAMERLALVENVQRADLDPVDEAHAYKRLMEHLGLSQRELAETIHKDHSYIVLRLRLIEDPRIETIVRTGKMSPTVGQEVARIADPLQRTKLIDQATRGERVRVQDVKAVRDPAPPKPRRASAPDVTSPPPREGGHLVNNSPDDRVTPVDGGSDSMGTPTNGNGHALYSAFQDWRARVYGEMDSLTTDERATLAHLLAVDVAQLRERLTDTRQKT